MTLGRTEAICKLDRSAAGGPRGRAGRGGATGAGNRGSPEPLFHTRRFHADGTATGESTDNHYTAHYVHTPCSSQSGVCLHGSLYMNPLYSSSFILHGIMGIGQPERLTRHSRIKEPSDVSTDRWTGGSRGGQLDRVLISAAVDEHDDSRHSTLYLSPGCRTVDV